MGQFDSMLTPERIIDLKAESKEEALRELISVISSAPEVTDPEDFFQAIMAREKIMSTGIGSGIGIAVPHAKIASVKDWVMAIGRKKDGLDFQSLDDQPVYLIFLIGTHESRKDQFLRVLARISLLMKNESFKRDLVNAPDTQAIFELLKDK